MEKIKKIMAALLVTGGAFYFTSCNQDDTAATEADDTTLQVTQTTDVNNSSEASDEASDDASDIFGGSSQARVQGFRQVPCNATIDTTQKEEGIIKITYNGKNCNEKRTRTGTITVQLIPGEGALPLWRNAGSKLILTFTDFKVTSHGNKTVTLNGTKVIINQSGGNKEHLPDSGLVHKERGNMTVAFDEDKALRVFWIAKIRTWDGEKFTIKGDSTSDAFTSGAEGGTNRKGESFYTTTPTAVEISACSSIFIATAGEIDHNVGSKVLKVKFGYKLENELPVEAHDCTATGMYMMWDNGKKEKTKFIGY